MQQYDVALKLLLQASTDLMRQLTGVSVARWLNVEMPQVLSSRVDLLGATASEALVHIELQSTNDPDMALRMAEYSLRIYRHSKSSPSKSSCMWVKRSCAWTRVSSGRTLSFNTPSLTPANSTGQSCWPVIAWKIISWRY
jgi:hypothetical protein